jgi:hypothetical protein
MLQYLTLLLTVILDVLLVFRLCFCKICHTVVTTQEIEVISLCRLRNSKKRRLAWGGDWPWRKPTKSTRVIRIIKINITRDP